jgi:RNA recognition motif-containing protein
VHWVDDVFQFGFGKNQPTNVLWLDELPSSITEPDLRALLTRLTNASAGQLLDIYIDYRTGLKNPTAQSLVYFNDVIAAQNAIDLIRGKRLDSKRIQVDFASKVFVTTFSDLIQQTNEKKASDPRINRSYQCDR